MSIETIASDVRQFIVDNFLFGDEGNLTNDSSFEQDGIVDSTGILELIMFLEETFEITIEDSDLTPENLDSIHKIEAFVQRKLAAVV